MPKPTTMNLHQQELHAKAQCHDWNTQHPDGALVSYEELYQQGETHRARTQGKAFVMCCQAVIFVEGISGAVSLDHCTVVEESQAVVAGQNPAPERIAQLVSDFAGCKLDPAQMQALTAIIEGLPVGHKLVDLIPAVADQPLLADLHGSLQRFADDGKYGHLFADPAE